MTAGDDPYTSRAFDRLAHAGLRSDARVLLLGGAGTVAAPAGTSWHVERRTGREPLTDADGAFDAMVVTGVLEHLEWDRWAIQQWHRVVRPGGFLVLTAPNLLGLSPGAVAFAIGRIFTRITRRLGLAGPRRFSARRYRRDALVRMIESLHFTVANDPAGAPQAVRGSDRLMLVATRQPTLSDRVASGSAPEPAAFVRTYEADQQRFVDLRTRWMARHPERTGWPCEPLDLDGLAGAKVLVMAPHADDELVGSAGTLLKLIERGAQVTVIHATDGSAGAALHDAPEAVRTTLRLEEAARVGSALGAAKLHFWKQDNRAFRVQPEAVAAMREVLEDLSPDVIFTPFVTDIHPDHFTLNRILEQGLAAARFDASRCRILYSEIWSLVPGNVYCDITSVEREVERLIELYETAMKVDDLSHLCESRAYYQSCRITGRPGFVETFFQAPASEHPHWMASVSPPHG